MKYTLFSDNIRGGSDPTSGVHSKKKGVYQSIINIKKMQLALHSSAK
jgi:hypothetical protein